MRKRSMRADLDEWVASRDRVLEEFAEAARDAHLVTFDVFDTLLRRRCGSPSGVFPLIAERLRFDDPHLAERFIERRVRAEASARSHAAREARCDITLSDIYAAFYEDQPESEGIAAPIALAALECEIELALVEANPSIAATFRGLRGRGIRIALVSDMYLPVDRIEKMLSASAIGGYDRLYLSHACGGSKANGSIWDIVRQDLALSPEANIVHLGDHEDADGTMARRHGITSFVLPAPPRADGRGKAPILCNDWLQQVCRVQHSLRETDVYLMAADEAYWREIGQSIVVPAALGLAAFIREVSARAETNRIFFLARDGRIFQKAFEATRLAGEPPSRYVWASRRCLNVAGIVDLDDADLDYLVSGRYPLSPSQCVMRLDLPLSGEVSSVLRRHFPDSERNLATREEKARLRDMLRDLSGPILEHARQEREALLAHLSQIGLFDGPAVVVDLGWHGSLQRSLIRLGAQVNGTPPKLVGVYLGTLADRPHHVSGVPMQAHGWLFEDGEPADVVAATVGQSFEVIELLFSAPEAGIQRVSLRDGVPEPERLPLDENEAARLAIAQVLHDTVVHSAAALGPMARWISAKTYRQTVISTLSSLVAAPTATDLAYMSNIRHAEGFGNSGFRDLIGTPPRTASPRALLRAYRESFWPRAFLSTIGPPLSWIVPAMASVHERLWRLRRHADTAETGHRNSANTIAGGHSVQEEKVVDHPGDLGGGLRKT